MARNWTLFALVAILAGGMGNGACESSDTQQDLGGTDDGTGLPDGTEDPGATDDPDDTGDDPDDTGASPTDTTDGTDSATGGDETDTDTAGDTTGGSDSGFTDADSDGWGGAFDCNDTDPAINPDALDTPGNGVDEDCDGSDDTTDDPVGDDPAWTDLSGTVMAPAGTFPIAGALVYLTAGAAPEIPETVFCYDCENMLGKKWALSGPDGSFSIANVPPGDWTLVTRKGFFQRARTITVGTDATMAVPVEMTTLPADESSDGLDQIPNYAVLLNNYDLSEDLLAKLGMGTLDGDGHLQMGTESFTLYNDANSGPGYQASTTLMSSVTNMKNFHMIFYPCICSQMMASNHKEKLRDYVISGGKIYASCWASQWAEQPFPAVIEFAGSDTAYNAGDVGIYSTDGKINDPDMSAWLQVVTPGSSPTAFPFTGAYIKIDSLADVDNGYGLPEDGGVVKPKAWVTDVDTYNGKPMTVTYNYGCGKVFYSVYQVVESSSSTAIRPQEYVLLYLILEVGVCEGDYGVE